MSFTYRYLKFKLNKNLLNECKSLNYYNYADRDLKDAITACAIKSPDGRPSNMFKVEPDTCNQYKFTSIVPKIPNIIPPQRIISGKFSNGGVRPFLIGSLFPPLFLEIDAASLATL